MTLHFSKTLLTSGLFALSAGVMAIPITTDIQTVVDESGSMSEEHAWLGTMMTQLDSALLSAAAGDTLSAQYGLVGFGGSSYSGHEDGHVHTVGSGDWGTATEFATATGGLVLNGATEDGYSGMSAALGVSGQANSVRNLILVTDEDRDNINGQSVEDMASALAADQALLNAVLSVSISCQDGSTALGVDSSGTGYLADGDGGFTTCEVANLSDGPFWYDDGSIGDYGNLALATGGAVWDLNQLRQGGNTALSFTAAFVDVKIQETIDVITNVAEPATFALFTLGLAGLAASRRKKQAV